MFVVSFSLGVANLSSFDGTHCTGHAANKFVLLIFFFLSAFALAVLIAVVAVHIVFDRPTEFRRSKKKSCLQTQKYRKIMKAVKITATLYQNELTNKNECVCCVSLCCVEILKDLRLPFDCVR